MFFPGLFERLLDVFVWFLEGFYSKKKLVGVLVGKVLEKPSSSQEKPAEKCLLQAENNEKHLKFATNCRKP